MLLPLFELWSDESGRAVADYAVTFVVILMIVIGTIGVIHSNANVVFWSSGTSVQ